MSGKLKPGPAWGTPEWHRAHSIYGVDFSRQVEDLLTDIRSQLVTLRGQLDDIRLGYPGYGERTQAVEGLLTCGIATLHGVLEDIKKSNATLTRNQNKRR